MEANLVCPNPGSEELYSFSLPSFDRFKKVFTHLFISTGKNTGKQWFEHVVKSMFSNILIINQQRAVL